MELISDYQKSSLKRMKVCGVVARRFAEGWSVTVVNPQGRVVYECPYDSFSDEHSATKEGVRWCQSTGKDFIVLE